MQKATTGQKGKRRRLRSVSAQVPKVFHLMSILYITHWPHVQKQNLIMHSNTSTNITVKESSKFAHKVLDTAWLIWKLGANNDKAIFLRCNKVTSPVFIFEGCSEAFQLDSSLSHLPFKRHKRSNISQVWLKWNTICADGCLSLHTCH